MTCDTILRCDRLTCMRKRIGQAPLYDPSIGCFQQPHRSTPLVPRKAQQSKLHRGDKPETWPPISSHPPMASTIAADRDSTGCFRIRVIGSHGAESFSPHGIRPQGMRRHQTAMTAECGDSRSCLLRQPPGTKE